MPFSFAMSVTFVMEMLLAVSLSTSLTFSVYNISGENMASKRVVKKKKNKKQKKKKSKAFIQQVTATGVSRITTYDQTAFGLTCEETVATPLPPCARRVVGPEPGPREGSWWWWGDRLRCLVRAASHPLLGIPSATLGRHMSAKSNYYRTIIYSITSCTYQ